MVESCCKRVYRVASTGANLGHEVDGYRRGRCLPEVRHQFAKGIGPDAV